MESKELESCWQMLTQDGQSEYVYRRVDNKCKPALNIGLDSTSQRCLILELPRAHAVDFQSTVKQNLSLEFFRDTDCIVLKLTNEAFFDLFTDLSISLYQNIAAMEEVDEYSNAFIQMFYKWSAFFDDSCFDRLSRAVIQGLFGELFILYAQLQEVGAGQINEVVDAWKGPYDQGHDFELGDKNIEVKTKLASSNAIRISSAIQLASAEGTGMELAVLSVEEDYVNGSTICEAVESVKLHIINGLGDVALLFKALAQKGIDSTNIHDYDNFKFLPVELSTFDCNMTNFPKLVSANLPSAIGKVTYELNVAALADYLISQEQY